MAPPGLGSVSLGRVRAGAGLLAISTVIALWSVWPAWEPPRGGAGYAAWLLVALGASIWLRVQPWRPRVMIFAVVVTTLWYALLALRIASELVGESTLNVGLVSAFVIGGVGLSLLTVAEAWAAVLAAILAVAAGMTLYVGLASTIFGGAHLWGVLVTASRGAYHSYDFRLASLLLLGMTMVSAGVLCLSAVRGLARGQRRAWDRAMIGTLLLLVVTVPIVYVPVQGLLAAAQAWPAGLNVIVLVAAWRRLAPA
jgi:hypothetical protein